MASAIVAALISTTLPLMADLAMEKVNAVVVDKVNGIVNIESNISNLKTTLGMIQDIVQVAEEKQIDKMLKKNQVSFIQNWLRDLVDISYEARDVLDDFITFSSCNITTEEASKPVNTVSSFMLSCFCGLSRDTSKLPLAVLNQLAKDIRSVRERFDEMKEEGKTFETLKSVVGGGSESVGVDRRREGPYINKQSDYNFVERKEVKQPIMEKILHPSDDNRVHVVAIWGMGGIGKTTLARSIYNDGSVEEHDYPTKNRKWLCVGEKKFSAKEIITKIVNDSSTTNDVENLQRKLVEKFRDNRFLIVLDDVWDVDGSEWDLLFNPLTNVGKGGLIIITTRTREVCTVTNTQTTYDLKPLSEDDSWSIFESRAFVDGKSDSAPDLKGIGKEIVKKLNGHPLALKVVGCSLLDKDSSTWTKFLESNDWRLIDDDNNNGIKSVLRWSYNQLPSNIIKTCFTYCALFPKDHVLDKKLLVQMWMAHDLIQKEERKRPEDVGAQYFEQLVNASLLQCVDGKYVMHDLIHDLAVLVSNGEITHVVSTNGSLSIDQMVRHIFITEDDYSKIPRLRSSKKLLTLYTTHNRIYTTEKFDYSVLDRVFKQLKSIRVLALDSYEITDIPDCISELRHLRYLDVSKTSVKRLPDSLCRLYNLQMLAARLDAVLPRDVVNMVNLRYIRAHLSTCKGVGKLTSLQELSSIRVCEDDDIRELGDMQRLRGKLKIEGLRNVTSSEDAAGALMDKQTLMDELSLGIDSARSTISDEEVLDALGCPPNLKYLRITGYSGVKSPSWMVDGTHKFEKLQTLKLSYCFNLESLPPLGELKSLKDLGLFNVGVKRLGDEFYGKFTDGKVFFPSLKWLSFRDMEVWKEWGDIIITKNSGVSFFPRLTDLVLEDCPMLESLPPLGELKSLKYLGLFNVGVKRLGDEFYSKFTDGKVFFPSLEWLSFSSMDVWKEWGDIIITENSGVSFFPRLTELVLNHCPMLESLPPLGELKSLKYLRLAKVGVKRLEDEFYGKFTDGKVFFPSLESLSFRDMEVWKEWGDIIITENSGVSFFPRLTELELDRCPMLESVFAVVENAANFMTSLSSLKIFHCDGLRSLPADGLPTSLRRLSIIDCPLLYRRYNDEFGPDRHKIDHIPDKDIRLRRR